MSEIQKSAESAASASTAREEPDFPANDQQLHYVYSLKDFQPFESATYRGIYISLHSFLFFFCTVQFQQDKLCNNVWSKLAEWSLVNRLS